MIDLGVFFMKIVGVIPARYASTRFPGKPLADICGKPMIWWVYQQAKKVRELDEVYVATDDERIETVCNEYGMLVVMTSSHHKTGTDRVAEVATKVDGDLFVNIQGDEPVIPPEMISEVIQKIVQLKVPCVTVKQAVKDLKKLQSDSSVKVVSDINDRVLLFSRALIPFSSSDKTEYFVHIGLYAFSKEFLLNFSKLKQSNLEKYESIELLRAIEHGMEVFIFASQYVSIAVDKAEHLEEVKRVLKIQQGENN